MQYLLPNRVYDLIKYVVTIILPAVCRAGWHLGMALRRRNLPHHRSGVHVPLRAHGH